MRIKSQWKPTLSVILQFSGKSLDAIYRVFPVVDGITNEAEGFLQLKFSGDEWLLLSGYSDGETFLAKSEKWHDPLDSPLDVETAAWVKENGKDELIDVSGLDQYRGLIGKPLTDIKGILYQIGVWHALCGVQLVFENKTLNFVYVADNCLVKEALENPPFEIVDIALILSEQD